LPSFAQLDLLDTLQLCLAEQQLVTPTEIQSRAIPELLGGASVVGVAETGSGKTLAYALPILHVLKSMELAGVPVANPAEPRAAVIVPTRELGEQVARVFRTFTHTTRLRVRTALGGAKMAIARENVKGPFEILVATPGRLIQLLDQKGVSLAAIKFLVLDEADQLLDLGFLPDAAKIANACPPARQMALFSATFPGPVEQLVARIFQHPVILRTAGAQRTVATLKTSNRTVADGKRFELLEALLAGGLDGSTLIFTNTREQCDKLAAQLKEAGHAVGVYRGEMDPTERRRSLQAFRDGAVPLLVATDVGARGLDVENVNRVINYHLPREMQTYLHRVGRTARAGREGEVINFVTERDAVLVAKLGSVAAPKKPRK
jgi:ATP-dependent RNA helicase RhlE